MLKLTLAMLLLSSCSMLKKKNIEPFAPSTFFTFQDGSGRYFLKKEIKLHKNKLVSRSQLFPINNTKKPVEKVLTVSLVNSNNNVVLPLKAKFNIWLDKEENQSTTKVDTTNKKVNINYLQKRKEYSDIEDFPKTSTACFYTQLIECLAMSNKLEQATKADIAVTILWDGFPFYQELYEGLGENFYADAILRLEERNKDGFKLALSMDNGQVIIYFLDNELKLDRMFWISQGISMIRQQRG